MYQTTANSNAFLMGSCRVSVQMSSLSTGHFIQLGSARGVKVTEAWDPMEVEIDNTPKVIIGAKKQTVTVEGNLLELDFQKLTEIRGGISIGTWSSANYTFDSGGNLTITPHVIYLTHMATSSLHTVEMVIKSATVTEGLTIPFVSDDKTDVSEIPFKFKGICDTSTTVGGQLYWITDSRDDIYSTSYLSATI